MRSNDFLLWESFRGLSNAKITQATIFIPILGYWILFNQHIMPYMSLWGDLNSVIDDEMQVPISLLYTYLGLCFIAVGSTLYQLFCPKEIKGYRSSVDFVSGIRNETSVYDLRKIAEFVRDKSKGSSFEEEYKIAMKRGDSALQAGHVSDKTVDLNRIDCLNLYYKIKNNSLFCVRLSILIFYILGFFLLSVPSVSIFSKVISQFLESFV